MTAMAKPFNAEETAWMTRALALAARGRGRVEPNPMVGCVLVRKGKVVGEGYHHRFGGAHAEVDALRKASAAARGSTAYVTLEPCCHFGKTPPCTAALINAGVRRVVAAMRDPFPKVCGQGAALLREAGIRVDLGLCEAEAIRLNGPYLKRQRLGLPWVMLKWAQSIDGKIATRTGDSQWISGEKSRRWVHQLRGRVDAILVGAGTVVRDDPLLTCRAGSPRRIATRIVLDPQLRTPTKSRLVRTARETPTILVASRGMSAARIRRYASSGVEVLGIRETRSGLDLRSLLSELARRGMTNVLVEGGGKTLGAFHDAALADEAVVFVSRRLMGGESAVSALAGRGPRVVADVKPPVEVALTRMGEDDVYRLLMTDPLQLV